MASFTERNGRWRAVVRRKGLAKALCKTFKTYDEAAKWARRQEVQVDGGRDPSIGERLNLSEAIAEFRSIRSAGNPIKKHSGLDTRLRNLDRVMGESMIASLTVGSVRRYCEARLQEGVAKATTLGEVTTLGTVLSEVSQELGATFPSVINRETRRKLMDNFRVIGPSKERDRRLVDDELDRLLSHLHAKFHDVTLFAVASAMRRGEILNLKWSDLDRKHQTIRVLRKYKRGKVLCEVPLLMGAYEIILRQPHLEGKARIFAGVEVSGKEWWRAFNAACVAAGIVDLHIHDLRHEAISRLFEMGYAIPEVAAVSGHRTWSQLRRYTQLKPRDLKHGPALKRGGLKIAA